MSETGNNLGEQNNTISSESLAVDGNSFMAYIRQIPLDNDLEGWAVFNEDGQQMAVFSSHDAAYFSARQNNLEPVSVH